MPLNLVHNLHIVDIRGSLLRAYWASDKTLEDATGQKVPAWEKGFLKFLDQILIPLLQASPPRKIVAVFDAGNEYRSALYPGYKKARKEKTKKTDKTNPVVREQINTLMKKAERFMAYLGVKCVKAPGQEADDLIALLVARLSGYKTVHTNDSDLLDLVSETCSVLLSGEYYGAGQTYKGIPLNLIRLHKSIVGDSTDGYIGIRDLGNKAWNELMERFGADGLEQIDACVRTGDFSVLETAHQVSNDHILGKILEGKRQWQLSYQLATLHPEACYGSRKNAPLRPVWNVRIPSQTEVHQMLMQVKAPDLLEHFSPHLPTFTLITADNHETLRDAADRLPAQEVTAFDFESFDSLKHPEYQQANKKGQFVDVLSQKITGISFCLGDNFQENYYVSIDHAGTKNLSTEWASWLLAALYTAKNRPVVQNANFELTVANRHLGLDLEAPYDTAILQSYVDENEESNLKDMTRARFNYQQMTYKEVTDGKPMNELSGMHVLQYGCDDSLVTAFHFDLQNIIMQLEGTWDFYEQKEVEHVVDNVNTFIGGTNIDYDALSSMEAEDKALIREKTSAIRKAMEDNCLAKTQQQQTTDAQNLLDLWWELEGAKLTAAGADEEEINSKYAELWNKAWYASVYVPFSEEKVYDTFIPTKTKVNNLLMLLGSPLRMDKVNKNELSKWFVENDEIVERSSEETKAFLKSMAGAADNFPAKKRSGPEYEALESYANELIVKYTSEAGAKTKSDGDALNFGSSPQMVAFIYGKLGLPLRARSKKTKGSARDKLGIKAAPATGNKASAAAIVYDLQDTKDWRRQVILDYMAVVKAQQNVSLYYTPYPLWKSPEDGLIHPQLKNCGTVTRRPSGTSPNVLQVSAKDDAKIRKAYIPPSKEYAYVCLDFNGQELRLTASESGDTQMVAAYIGAEKKDIHSLTASGFSHIILPREGWSQFHAPMGYSQYITGLRGEYSGLEGDYAKAFNLVRKLAKAVNFLIIYGGGYTTLAQNLLIALELAKHMMSSTFALYSGLQPWQKRVAEFARSHGYVETAYGNRRHMTKDLYSRDDFLRMRQERQAVNATIQGCAADILKHVLNEMRQRKLHSRYKLKSLMPVYDEVAAGVPIVAIPDYIEEMKEIMEITPPGHLVPMEIEAAIGLESWGGKIELGRPSYVEVQEFLLKQKEVA